MKTAKCDVLYKDFVQKKVTLEQLQGEGCYAEGSFEVKPILNPVNSSETCRVISQRKDYYNQT